MSKSLVLMLAQPKTSWGWHEFLISIELVRKLTVGVKAERDEMALFIASEDILASCAFRVEEWDKKS